MTINKILDYALPITQEDKKCSVKMQKKQWQRERLTKMIVDYKNGEIVNFEPLKISVDMEPILQKLRN